MSLLNIRLQFHKENEHIVDIFHTDSTTTREVKIILFEDDGVVVSHVRGKSDFNGLSYISKNYIGAITPNYFYNGHCNKHGIKKKEENFE